MNARPKLRKASVDELCLDLRSTPGDESVRSDFRPVRNGTHPGVESSSKPDLILVVNTEFPTPTRCHPERSEASAARNLAKTCSAWLNHRIGLFPTVDLELTSNR